MKHSLASRSRYHRRSEFNFFEKGESRCPYRDLSIVISQLCFLSHRVRNVHPSRTYVRTYISRSLIGAASIWHERLWPTSYVVISGEGSRRGPRLASGTRARICRRRFREHPPQGNVENNCKRGMSGARESDIGGRKRRHAPLDEHSPEENEGCVYIGA